jgi:pimeloyl-ACP methyl ester carboxylesterase
VWLLILAGLWTSAAKADNAAVAGHWEGMVEIPGVPLPFAIDLEERSGVWSGTIDFPAQGMKALALRGVTVEGASVRFTVAGVPGDPTFEGKLEGKAITGGFRQGAERFTFRLGREKRAGPRRPQTPKPPFPYRVEQVSYGHDGITLAGTLTLPAGDGPFPAVVMITGSGAQDRDDTIFEHKPFLLLADHLTRRGIAVLRVDDRGVGGSSGSVDTATIDDTIADVLAGLRLLHGRPEIAGDRIGLMGQSEGGAIAPAVALRSGEIAFVVLLAAPGVPGHEISARQLETFLTLQKVPRNVIDLKLETQRRAQRIILDEADDARRTARLREHFTAEAATATPEEIAYFGSREAYIEASVAIWSLPRMRYFSAFDPRIALGKLSVPVLALNGTLDLQVDPEQNLPEIEKALAQAGNADVTLRRLPGLNHLLQPARTGDMSEYALIETTIDPPVLDIISDWIIKRFGD